MHPNDDLRMTPVKKRHEVDLKLINSPTEKAEDLYERLISASPPKRLFQYEENSQIEEEDPQSSYMSPEEEDSRMTPEEQECVEKSRNFNGQEQSIRKVTTPLKASKGCKCEKSHCLKKYCDCFKVGEVCSDDCSCVGCQNTEVTEQHEKLVKMIELTRSGKGGKEVKCNCQRSHCLKNYCQCHSLGKSCSSACNCLECENRMESTTKTRKKRQFLQVSQWTGKPGNSNVLFN